MIVESAPAKINLTLEVLGRRTDGYHELSSLVAFARDAADTIEMHPGDAASIEVDGPFGSAIVGENIVGRAIHALRLHGVGLGTVKLTKHLPVASGIGGGSADAAAVLRAARALDPERDQSVPWPEIAAGLGADVTACFASRALILSGAGASIAPLAEFPALYAVLVNPMAPVPHDKTARVFRSMAIATGALRPASAIPNRFTGAGEVLDFIRGRTNDMTAAAQSVVPVIADVLATLETIQGCRVARLSGAGPTCFGLFDSAAVAREAADRLRAAHPTWWVTASRLA